MSLWQLPQVTVPWVPKTRKIKNTMAFGEYESPPLHTSIGRTWPHESGSPKITCGVVFPSTPDLFHQTHTGYFFTVNIHRHLLRICHVSQRSAQASTRHEVIECWRDSTDIERGPDFTALYLETFEVERREPVAPQLARLQTCRILSVGLLSWPRSGLPSMRQMTFQKIWPSVTQKWLHWSSNLAQ